MPDRDAESVWQQFAQEEHLTEPQLVKFKRYHELLMSWNERMNLTAIVDLQAVINDHFRDALSILHAECVQPNMTLCDVGSGGGIPGIPIAIVRSDISIVLLEVNQKKISFLRAVIEALGLEHVTVCTLDWRTFISKVPQPVDIFCARASLKPAELLRIFQGTSKYRSALLVYWASRLWEPEEQEKLFYTADNWYTLGKKRRRLAFFKDLARRSHAAVRAKKTS